MRNLYIILALAALAFMLCSCPAPNSEGGGGTVKTTDSGDDKAPATENTDAGDGADADAPSHPLLDVELDLVPCDYTVDGAKLGIGYEEYTLRHGEDANYQDMWVVEGVLGMSNKYNTQEDPMPTEAAVFQDGSLVSFMWADSMDEDAYAIALMDAVDAYGDYLDEPADWVKESPFFPDGYTPIEDLEVAYWNDEESRSMLIYIFDAKEQIGAQMALYVDHHYAASDAAFEEMNRQMEAMMAEQMQKMQEEGAMPGAEGEVPFMIEEEPVDIDEEIEDAEEAEADAAAEDSGEEHGEDGHE